VSIRALIRVGFLSLFVFAACIRPAARKAASPSPPDPGTLPEAWLAGVSCETEPVIQVHAYNEDLYVLRQSKCSHFEAPFLYLLFGEEKALLLDTGSLGEPPVAATVERIREKRARKKGKDPAHLVVAHSHSHFDHIQCDRQFEGLPNTTVVGHRVEDVARFFGIEEWPEGIVAFDLGGRVLDVIPTPGHHPAHIAIYDRRTQVLLTGDTLYPGFLFVFSPNHWDDFRRSTRRMVDFVAGHPVSRILGCHIEMSRTPGKSYPYGTRVHPEERSLELGVEHLLELQDALLAMGEEAAIEAHDDFVIYPAWRAERFQRPPRDAR